jgi:cytochrome c5
VGRTVSKQDTQFFNVFSLVIGILVVVTILLFAFSRVVANRTQGQQVMVEPQYLQSVEDRLRPFARVAIAGQDNAALAIVEGTAGGPGTAAVLPTAGDEVYKLACAACHSPGIAGAPRSGDRVAWAPRLAKGAQTLYTHAIDGFQGSAGLMPPKGGRLDLSDDAVRAAVDYMMELNR